MYDASLGGRFGFAKGISYKSFVSETKAVEGIVSNFNHGFLAIVLMEHHQAFASAPNLYWYVGYGAHLGYWTGDGVGRSGYFTGGGPRTVIGVDLVAGLEYPFPDLPFTVALDLKPGVNLIGVQAFEPKGAGLSIRYVF